MEPLTISAMPTGYSGKPLVEKLGIQPGMSVHVVAAPDDYAALLAPLPQGVQLQTHADTAALARALSKHGGVASFIHCFVLSRVQLAGAGLAQTLAPGGTLWVSWPKLAAARKLGLPGDISEEALRELLLPTGLVDVKVCAVSALWSGLKFLWRRSA